ncbi:hypothetical protein FQN57_005387 [Myotisia sp. PD_48]|nr:hypothetical protein FQN57_005387 [Myotisia sp. PD_48]
MVKPLTFKGDKKAKKRKRPVDENSAEKRVSRREAASAPSDNDDEDGQNWVSANVPTDIMGPIIIVLPSSPPTCIACDINGKVFPSELENMIEGNASTAEPHDVRQVWVATKIVGTEGYSFKGHHGKYLSCDQYGILSATSSAISALESFVPLPCPDAPGMIALQIYGGDKEAYVSIKDESLSSKQIPPVEIRGDATEISFSSSLRIKMQARFRPKSKSAAARESKALEKISRKELEAAVGRSLNEDEVKRLRKSRREGNYHEELLNVKVKGKHDKFAYSDGATCIKSEAA